MLYGARGPEVPAHERGGLKPGGLPVYHIWMVAVMDICWLPGMDARGNTSARMLALKRRMPIIVFTAVVPSS